MPGLVPGIHAFLTSASKTWMAGTSPAMTIVGMVKAKTPPGLLLAAFLLPWASGETRRRRNPYARFAAASAATLSLSG